MSEPGNPMENKNNCTLYLVRHGETEWNKNHTIMGQMDSPLTPEGVGQVQATAETLKHIHFDAIFSSDSPRAQQTAQIIKLDRQLAIQTSKLLRERNFGHYEGGPAADYHEAVKHLLEEKERLTEQEQWKFKFGEDMESDAELADRFIVQLREIAVAYPNKTVLVTTHGGCIRMFLIRTGYVKYGLLPGGAFKNAGYVKALSDGVDFFIKEVEGINDVQTKLP
jgi:broad specificity phosphatase PhoE